MPAPELHKALIETVIRSRILDRVTLAQLYSTPEARATDSPEQFGKYLVGCGALTQFQWDKLAAGHWQGLIIGRYALLYPIGRGGMGIVYLARRTDGEKPGLVALKLLAPKRARSEPRTLARFLREMEIGAKLPAHAALTRALDSGAADGIHFLALEFVGGVTAKQRVREHGPMAVADAARLFADLALGLHQAHEAGYIHRDLKPANVIVTPDGRGKLLDFGFAVRRGEKPLADPAILGGQGYTLGTMDFLPPEQATDAVSVSAETDIYSLGCSLYYVLTGLVPFPFGTAREKIHQHRTASPTPVAQLNPSVPDGLGKLVQWMMAKRPEDRPPSCRAVAAELERWTEPAPSIAAPETFDAAWEADVLKQVETRWLAHRTTIMGSATLEELPVPEETPVAVTATTPFVAPIRRRRFPWVIGACVGAVFLGMFVYLVRRP